MDDCVALTHAAFSLLYSLFLTSCLIVWLLQVVSPTISSPVCQEQLIEAGKLVERSVESCVQACLSATEDGELLKQVSVAQPLNFSLS